MHAIEPFSALFVAAVSSVLELPCLYVGVLGPPAAPGWVGSLRVGQLWPKVGGALAGAAEQQQVHFLEEKGPQVCDQSTHIHHG